MDQQSPHAAARHDEMAAWLTAAGAVGFVVFLAWKARQFVRTAPEKMGMSNVRATLTTQRELSIAMQSGLVYILFSLPLAWTGIQHFLPANFIANWKWFPFWYAFVVATSIGGCVGGGVWSFLGSMLSMLAMVIMNFIIPGGSEAMGNDNGFLMILASVCTAIIVFLVFLSGLDVTAKQYFLGNFASLVIPFLDPNDASVAAEGIIWTGSQVNWSGNSLCLLYVIILVIPLSALTIPRWFPPGHGITYSSLEVASRGLEDLCRDTVSMMDHLLTHFHKGTSQYVLTSTDLEIQKLGSRRTLLEGSLKTAQWEVVLSTSRKKHLYMLWRFAEMMQGFRQVLRIMLKALRHRSDSGDFSVNDSNREAISEHLNVFTTSVVDAMKVLGQATSLSSKIDEASHQAVADSAACADTAVKDILHCLGCVHLTQSTSTDIAFVDALREAPVLMLGYLRELCDVETQPRPGILGKSNLGVLMKQKSAPLLSPKTSSFKTSSFEHLIHLCKSFVPPSDRWFHATLNTTSWMLAFVWSTQVRPHKSACTLCVSFIFSASIGALFDRNINRMLGVALGFVMGHLPATLLLNPGSNTLGGFTHLPQGPVIYLSAMWLMWVVAMYGYLATGGRWNYACLLWVGFGGTQMLGHWCFLNTQGAESKADIFGDILDNFTGCFIVFFVDVLFARMTGWQTTQRVAVVVPACVDNIATVIDDFRRGNVVAENIESLKQQIALSRHWAAEADREDLVWSMMVGHYKRGLVLALLDECDDAYVAAVALQATAQRLDLEMHPGLVRRHVADVLPSSLSESARLFAYQINSLLNEGLPSSVFDIEQRRWRDSRRDPGIRHALSSLRPSLSRELSFPDTPEDAMLRGAIATLTHSADSLNLAVHRIRVLLEDFI